MKMTFLGSELFFAVYDFPLHILAWASKRQMQYVLLVCKCFNAAHFGLCKHTHHSTTIIQCRYCVCHPLRPPLASITVSLEEAINTSA